jgi:hypothetical protein
VKLLIRNASKIMCRPLVVCVALEGYSKIFDRCIKTQRQYSDRYGYDYLLVERLSRSVTPEEAAWLKIGIIIRALDKNRPWVATFDADCEIRPQTPRLESLEAHGKSVYIANGFSGRLNSGVMIVSNHEDSKTLFTRILAHAGGSVPMECRAPYENGHVIHFATGHSAVQSLEHARWNNNSQLDSDSYIQHYTGPLRRQYLERYDIQFMERQILKKQPLREGCVATSDRKLETRLSQDLDELDAEI